MNKTLLSLSLLNLTVSAVTLTVALAGAKKVADEMAELKTKTNKTVIAVKRALEDIDL